jgi:biopolymer transport protein ExbD
MRRRLLNHASQTSDHGINVTPMIDVVMCLIVFFLIVSKLAADQLAGVKLPEASAAAAGESSEAVVINIAPGEGGAAPVWPGGGARVAIGTRLINSSDEFEDQLKLRVSDVAIRLAGPGGTPSYAKVPVRLRADRTLTYGQVEPVMRTLAKLGITKVLIATEQRP